MITIIEVLSSLAGHSVDFFMRPDAFQENGLVVFILDKFEDDPEIIACSACPGAFQLTFQLMGPKDWMEGILRQQLQGCPDVIHKVRVPFYDSACRTNEGIGSE
jgi:hypothetical protein